jgi:hypothetical protein
LVRTNAEPRPGCTCINSINDRNNPYERVFGQSLAPLSALARASEKLDKAPRVRPRPIVVVSHAPVILHGAESISRERPTLKSAVEHVSA